MNRLVCTTLVFGLACIPRPTPPPEPGAPVFALVDPVLHGDFAHRGYLRVRLTGLRPLRTHWVPAEAVARFGQALLTAEPCFHGSGCSTFSRGESAVTETLVLFDTSSMRRYYIARKLPGKPTILIGLLSVNLNAEGTYMNSGPLSCFEAHDLEDLYERMLRDIPTWAAGPIVQEYLFHEKSRPGEKEGADG